MFAMLVFDLFKMVASGNFTTAKDDCFGDFLPKSLRGFILISESPKILDPFLAIWFGLMLYSSSFRRVVEFNYFYGT